ncbi:MAG TPA: DUF1592 domain-containing protein [Planctomycetota bacterium]|nr:DUF1592 domain-containing protein [Planctomycetota bacterium]
MVARRILSFLGLAVVSFGACSGDPARRTSSEPLDQRFASQLQPFFERYCFSCHNPKKKKGDLDLTHDFSVAAIARNARLWEQIQARIREQEMPPEDAKQPKDEDRHAAVAWLRELGDREAARNAGDPGIVLARRLSNAEFDTTIRDLTGVDIRPTREFPVDPANEAGFDNSGESLAMSEALLRKVLAAARFVSDHAVLKPDGFVFAPYPAVTDTDRDKYGVQRIVDFYRRHEVRIADYFMAARGHPVPGLSSRYVAAIQAFFEEAPPAGSPVEELWSQWRKLPADPAGARKGCDELAERVARLRATFLPELDALVVKGVSRGSQWLLLWRNDQIAAQHLVPPAKGDAGVARFCRTFPDTFAVLERGPYYDKSASPKGRFLSAGFHLMQGYYRDDAPLVELILDDAARREIDTLWNELHFVSQDALRQYKDFIFFERAEPPRFLFEATFDFARSEDKDAVSDAKIRQLREAYLIKARDKGATPTALTAIEAYFKGIQAKIRGVEEARRAAEPGQLAALLAFAARAWRRPLSGAERDDLLAFYRQLRERDQLGHEDAFRDTLASVFMSPNFCYRFSVSRGGPLTDYELASRLSYFLWSSMPDAELLDRAAAGELRRPEVLKAQARRMLRDPKVRGLATEFAGNWLDFRRFDEHNAVDRDRFPSFTAELRQAMFEEPIRYVVDVARRNRSVLDLLYGNDTVVNRALAKHYGMPEPATEEWVAVDDAREYGRGGLLPMAVFLTKNAPGLRTSPVKRGYWVVRRLLGEVIPPPPPTVPTLPKDEADLGELTLPQVLARHRDDRACAGCHRRFDSVGVVFEGFGPIGERREKDLGGKPVQTAAPFPDGKDRDGLAGLRAYLRERRQGDFVNNLCRKLLSYALGRSLQPSDRSTLASMRARLEAENHAFGSLVEVIVTSPQFLNKRGPE